jgi:integrase/recombinase XerD
MDIFTIQKLLGHTSIKTTTIYLHLVHQRIAQLKSPLDYLVCETEGSDEKK